MYKIYDWRHKKLIELEGKPIIDIPMMDWTQYPVTFFFILFFFVLTII